MLVCIFIASHCLSFHLIFMNVQRSVWHFSFLPHPFSQWFSFIFVAFLITIIYRLTNIFHTHSHIWIMTLIWLYTFLLWLLYNFITLLHIGATNKEFNLNFRENKKKKTVLTWHSYMPWSLRCTNLICSVQVLVPGVCRMPNRSSFVYIWSPDDKMCQSRRRIQVIWFCFYGKFEETSVIVVKSNQNLFNSASRVFRCTYITYCSVPTSDRNIEKYNKLLFFFLEFQFHLN